MEPSNQNKLASLKESGIQSEERGSVNLNGVLPLSRIKKMIKMSSAHANVSAGSVKLVQLCSEEYLRAFARVASTVAQEAGRKTIQPKDLERVIKDYWAFSLLEGALTDWPDKVKLNETGDDSSSVSSEQEHDLHEDIGQGFFENEQSEERDAGDSDVSEERNPDDFINTELSAVKLEGDHDRPREPISIISSAFNNRKTFFCPKTKPTFVTGKSTADLSPEDIGIIAALGDALSTGKGLWSQTNNPNFIEFRGAAFTIGGDATIDGLITIPNILREFSGKDLHGVSHGMGARAELPDHQLNVAMGGATSRDMPEQAHELVKRLSELKDVDVYNTWSMIIITIGTEEICQNCSIPETDALRETIDILNRGIHKALVIMLGPIHVSSSYHQKANLLRTRCACFKDKEESFITSLSNKWSKAFEDVQEHADKYKRQHFSILTLPMLTITSRYPYSLFIPNKPLLNRRGHSYATKWLWNRLIAGPRYNLSKAILSQDAYYCPAVGCPYFRIPENYADCKILLHSDANALEQAAAELAAMNQKTIYDLYFTAVLVVCIAFITVLGLGTFFYHRSKMGTRRRFDAPQMPTGLVSKHRATTIRRQPSVKSIISEASDKVPLRTKAATLDISRPPSPPESSDD
ncbi:Phospholipase B1, membrane-associated [Aphelenchoides bicaudatus]|nr:Phospholipase B1, membrane-associated [Aphelenchoides bicaudatus]